MKTYARIMYDRHGGSRRCVVVVANNENDAAAERNGHNDEKTLPNNW